MIVRFSDFVRCDCIFMEKSVDKWTFESGFGDAKLVFCAATLGSDIETFLLLKSEVEVNDENQHKLKVWT